ncbi:MAG: methylenetetrahydrofolate reductase [Thermoplasmata archaeon]|nr:methylenetetrahydrofolate reductase [Thermoplasmata archaeon]
MARDLTAALARRPLFFEPVPPSARTSVPRSAAHRREVVDRLQGIARLDAVDVPELVDENHDGRPYYRSGDVRPFARQLADELSREVVINKVVAHLPSGELERWVAESVARGLKHLVLVGGSSRYIPYPGPSVTEANRVAHPLLEAAGGRLGNIAIPQRTGEAHRMLQKTRSGASFFTTQIVFDSETTRKMVREYDRLCRQSGLTPASILVSVAPVADEGDAEFVRWLGADIPEAAEHVLLTGDDGDAGPRSIAHALEVWNQVLVGAASDGVEVPLGVNVEQISQRHLATAVEMARAFAAVMDRTPGA